MKNYRQMSTEERVQYNASFTRWYANRDQITLCAQQTGALDTAARAAFDEGVQLLQAWPFGIKFLDSLRCLPAVRCVPRLMQLADFARQQMSDAHFAPAPAQTAAPAAVAPPAATAPAPTAPASAAASPAATVPGASAPGFPASTPAATPAAAPLPIANLHIDQLIYLLSPHTAERARSLKAKLDERDINSNRAKDLAIAGATNDAIAPFARAASEAQQFVTETYALIDDELAEYVAIDLYITNHRDTPEDRNAADATLSLHQELAKPFGSVDRLYAALTPYYRKANADGRIDRIVARRFEKRAAAARASESAATRAAGTAESASPLLASSAESNSQSSPSRGAEGVSSSYDPAEYKRIWTYVNRKDVAHTQKRLVKMRTEIDTAKNAGMPNIDAMEAIYAHEAELVLAAQQKALNDGEPSLL